MHQSTTREAKMLSDRERMIAQLAFLQGMRAGLKKGSEVASAKSAYTTISGIGIHIQALEKMEVQDASLLGLDLAKIEERCDG
jgi:hypothetical protein